MLPPTAGMLEILASYPNGAELLAAAARAESGPDRRVHLASEAGQWRVILPGATLRDGEPGARIQELEAWVRLCPCTKD